MHLQTAMGIDWPSCVLFFCSSLCIFSVREEDLVMALKMAPRDVHRICGKLKQDRLLKMLVFSLRSGREGKSVCVRVRVYVYACFGD